MKKLLLYIFIPIGSCLLCVGLYMLLFNSKIGSHQINDIDRLMVNINDFPPGWKLWYSEPIQGRNDWGEDNLSKAFSFESDKGYSQQYLYRFNNIFEAMYANFFLSRELPIVRDNITSYLMYKSHVADDWYFECGSTDSGGIACDALGRYDDFISYFHIVVSRENFSPEQLEKILRAIDDRMADHLKGGRQ